MSFFRSLAQGLSFAVALAAIAPAATHPRVSVQPQARILKKVDNADATLRPHTTTDKIAQATDQGRVPANTQFSHMILVLKSTDEQEFALAGLLDQQQDKSSPNYHQWMTPETFGAAFGVAPGDIAQITAWLQDSGFTVDSIAKSARLIQFSGSCAQVEAAFHTEMHSYVFDGETHIANSADISIPSALANVVVGVASLNNFKPKANMINPHQVVLGQDGQMHPAIAGTTSPDYTSASSGTHYVGAGDLATLFNTKPLLNAGIDGKGVSIGIIGRTDILLSDVQIYRSLFNLPKNDPTFTQIGTDPGTISDDGESDLDVELSGGIAPGASINFVTSGDSYFGGGIDAAGVYLVENNNADIISLSYGSCESGLGANGNAFYNILWEQAASQGQTVFVSSGDSGPSTCNSSSAAYSTTGYGVNGLGSTPYNVAVGGSMFNEGNTTTGATNYWGAAAGAPYSTALSYIPEIPWNEGRFDVYPGGYGGIVSAGSGVSLYYGTPSFQAGPGVPTADPTPNSGTVTGFVVPGPHRYLPDVALEAAGGHDGTIFCSEGSCKINADGTVGGIGVVGGTSVAAPSMAGVQALINQKNGGRQGNANYYYYRVAATQSQTNCVAATYLTLADSTCGFHDITTGNLNIPSNAAGTTLVGWNAGAGYDLAVGLGTPDVANLATRWSTVTFNATTTALTLSPTTGITHGASQNVTIAVAPVSGTGTPTGDVSIIANAAYGGVGFYTLSGGMVNGTLSGLPAGTYTVYAHYAGDATYGGSNSAPITVTISPEGSVLTAHSYLLATNGGLSATTSYLYGANVYLDAQVAGASATGTPTGNVTFALTKGTTALTPYVSPLDSFADAYFDAGLGYAGYLIMPTSPVLSPGTYTANISYSGDTSFNASTATPITFTVTPANQALALRAVSAEITSGATATFNASITTISPAAGGLPATGTVTFTDTTTSTVLGTGTLVNGAVVFTTNAITTSGAHSITATYSGDANYLTKTATAVTITVGGAASTITVTASTLNAPVGTSVTLTATVPTGSTGTVFFYDNGVSLGGANISATTLTAAIAVTTFAARTHTITATSSGNATLAAGTSAPIVITITQNPTTVQLTSQQSNANSSTVAMNAVVIPNPRGTAGNNPPPTGLVQFLDGTTVLGTATPVYLPGGYNNYVATFTTQALKPGPHTLTATYAGDTNFATSTSNAQTVNIGLTTPTLTASTTSVGTGIAFTLTDRIVPQVASTSVLGGAVTFFDGPTSLGTATVTSGVATLSTAVLVGVGPHSITAVYSGDSNFYTSTTQATNITVVQAPATPTLAVSATTVQVGTSVTLTATTPTYSTGTVTFLDNGVALGTGMLTGTVPTASITVTSFGARVHTLTAMYSGDTNFLTGTSAAAILTVTPNTPTLQLSALQNAAAASALTLTATLTPVPAGAKPNNPAPSGSIQYTDGSTILGSSPVQALTDGSGNYGAPFTTAVLKPGPHTITATYLGDANYTAAVSGTQAVSLGLTSTALTASATTVQVGATVTLTATISTAATGTVTFFDGGAALGTATVTGTTASLAVTSFAARTHTLTATYSGDANYYTSTSAAASVVVTQNTPILQLAALQNTSAAAAIPVNVVLVPVPSGTKLYNPAPSGSVQYSDGTTILGSAAIVALTDGSGNYAAPFTTPVLKPGTHSVTAIYSGDTNYTSASSTAQTVSLGVTTVALTASSTTVGLGTPFLLTARITPVVGGTTSIGGTVTFSDGATVLGTSIVTAGVATITAALAATASATHTITAVYSGDASFLTSTAAGITVTTVTPGVAVSINPGSLTISRGSSGSAVVSVTTTGNYSGTVTPTCTGLPAFATCTFSSTPLIFSGVNGTQTTTVTIATTAPIVASSSLLWLPALLLAGFVTIRRKELTGHVRHLLLLAVMVCGFMAVTGCGTSNTITTPTTTGGTPLGTSTVTVNLSAIGTTSASPTGQSTATLALTVQ